MGKGIEMKFHIYLNDNSHSTIEITIALVEEMSVRGNVQVRKCPFGELSCQGNCRGNVR